MGYTTVVVCRYIDVLEFNSAAKSTIKVIIVIFLVDYS